MPSVLSALPIAAAVLVSTAPAPPSRDIENVAAFARLYGVVRFFYPSDAAADLDWNRFAVHGVPRVRGARDTRELGAALRELVAPLGPGLEIGATLPPAATVATTCEPLVAWRYLGPGFSTIGGPYRLKRTHRVQPRPAPGGFATLMQVVPAARLRGKAIRLTAQARATAPEPGDGGALWLRVDRPNQTMGFFDNMGDRPIRKPEWRPYAIEGTVADDAENVAFGVMVVSAATADFDAVELAVKGATGGWAPVPIGDAGFEAKEGEKGGWFKTGSMDAAISRPADGAAQGAQYVRLAPAPAPAAGADEELFPEGAPTPGSHADVELGSGLRARVPLALTDAEARPDPSRQKDLDALRSALADVPGPASAPDLDQRLADVVVAWNVLRHFYPYWTEARVDWDTRLQPSWRWRGPPDRGRRSGTRSGAWSRMRATATGASSTRSTRPGERSCR